MKCKTKKIVSLFIVIAMTLAISFTFSACDKNNTLLDPKKPTTLTMWHVYGEQVNSPMNAFIEQFNATIGKEKGIIINVTLMSNASQIGKKLKDAQKHPEKYQNLQVRVFGWNVLWNNLSEKEQNAYITRAENIKGEV